MIRRLTGAWSLAKARTTELGDRSIARSNNTPFWISNKRVREDEIPSHCTATLVGHKRGSSWLTRRVGSHAYYVSLFKNNDVLTNFTSIDSILFYENENNSGNMKFTRELFLTLSGRKNCSEHLSWYINALLRCRLSFGSIGGQGGKQNLINDDFSFGHRL